MLPYVKTLQITEDEWKKYGAAIESPLRLFPQLQTLEIWDGTSRRLYANQGYDPALIIRERIVLPSRLVIVRKASWKTEEILFPPTVPGSATTSISTISAVWIRDRLNGYTTLTNLPYRDRLMASIIFHVRTTLAARAQNHDSVFANLNTFVCKHSEKLEADDIVALLSVCPKLVELSVNIKEGAQNADKIGPVLASMSDTLKIITLGGAGIEWLPFLRKCHRVSLIFSSLPSSGWMRDATGRAGSSNSQEPALEYLTLQFGTYWSWPQSGFAEYLEVSIGSLSELTIQIRYDDKQSKRWTSELRSDINRLRRIKANRVYTGPGFRLIEPGTPTSINSNP